MSTPVPDNSVLAHRFAEMLNTGDVDLVDGFIAPAYVNHNPFVADGPEANKAFWRQWLTAFPATRVTVEDAFAVGNKVVGRFTYRATHQALFMGIPPTGRAVEMRSIDIWRVANGRFVEHWDELNMLEFMQQLGAMPAR
jgi:steroid delta-isomerase-like uncharacterized protein